MKRLVVSLAIPIVLFLAPRVADACTCARNCNEMMCPDGCQIDLPTPPCGCTCSGGSCTYNCKGSGGIECREASVMGACDASPSANGQPGSCAPGETALGRGWAVIEYFTDGQTAAIESDVTAIAASSPSFGADAARQFLHGLNQEIAYAKTEAAKSQNPPVPIGRLRFATLIFNGPARRPAITPKASLSNKQAPDTFKAGTRAYVWGRTDSNGRVREVKILHSPLAGGDQIASLVKESLTVRSEGTDGPAEFAGFFGVFEGGQMGFALSTYLPADTTLDPVNQQ